MFYFLWLSFLVKLALADNGVHPMDRVVKDYHGQAYLDFRQKYHLEWTIDWRSNTMLFNITVATNGWIGFGFSKDGKMKEADLVIAGVATNRQPYVTVKTSISN